MNNEYQIYLDRTRFGPHAAGRDGYNGSIALSGELARIIRTALPGVPVAEFTMCCRACQLALMDLGILVTNELVRKTIVRCGRIDH
jgi:hypothetical protein